MMADILTLYVKGMLTYNSVFLCVTGSNLHDGLLPGDYSQVPEEGQAKA